MGIKSIKNKRDFLHFLCSALEVGKTDGCEKVPKRDRGMDYCKNPLPVYFTYDECRAC